jgi:hypothetical protein
LSIAGYFRDGGFINFSTGFLHPGYLKRMIDPTRLEHFRNLVSLCAADGSIKDIERIALSKIAYAHDIPLERLNFMLTKASEYVYLIPQNTRDRERQMEEMIQLAWVDGDFAIAEKELIGMVGAKLGFSAPQVDDMILKSRVLN